MIGRLFKGAAPRITQMCTFANNLHRSHEMINLPLAHFVCPEVFEESFGAFKPLENTSLLESYERVL